MQIKEALNALNDGHTIWKIGFARRVCKAFDLPFNEEELVQQFYTKDGYIMGEGNEGALGVDSCYLSQYVADQLGVARQAKDFIGAGSQARENARVVREELKRLGKI